MVFGDSVSNQNRPRSDCALCKLIWFFANAYFVSIILYLEALNKKLVDGDEVLEQIEPWRRIDAYQLSKMNCNFMYHVMYFMLSII